MKIIIAHYKYYIQGGPERYMFKFMELAAKHGCEVIPFSVNYTKNIESNYTKYFVGDNNAGGNYDSSNHSFSYLFKNVYHEFHNREAYKKLIRLIKDTKPDLIYSLIPGQLTPDIYKAAHKMNIPVILRISDFRLICGKYSMIRNGRICEDCLGGEYKNCAKNRCVKGSRLLSILRSISLSYHRRHKSYRYVDAIITPPSFTKELLVRDGYFPASKIYVNPTFVNANQVEKPADDKYLLCLGRFAPEKGYQYAIEAMKYLKDYDIRLAITGDSTDLDDSSMKVIEENQLYDRIDFLGFIGGDVLENTIKKSFVICAPAVWYENMPNTVLEAYSYGKPVIASRVGCFPEIVDDGRTGYLFNMADSSDLASKVKLLLENPGQYDRMCNQAFKKCIDDFSPQKHWERFVSVLERTQCKSD